ncbi:MAG: hypothetical protein AAF197_00375 [Pseudomonadota bacterium]
MLNSNPEFFPIHMTGNLTQRQKDILRLEEFEPLSGEERDEQKANVYFCYLETHDFLKERFPEKKITDNKVFDHMMNNQMVDGEIAQYSKVMLYAIIKRYKEQDQYSLLK